MCHVDFTQLGLWQPTYRVPQASIACNLLSALGSYRVQSLSEKEPIERTGSEQLETTIRKRRLGFQLIMFGRLVVQWPKREGRSVTSWWSCLQKTPEAFRVIPSKGKGHKRVTFGVVAKDGRDWMTPAKNVDMLHQGVGKGAEAYDDAWQRADIHQSNVRRQRKSSGFVQ